jgi:AP-2 complex subunit mu-1
LVQKEEAVLIQVDLTVKSLFDRSLSANGIVVGIPVPPQTAKVSIKKSKGDAKYDGACSIIRWTINKFSGQKEHSLSADVLLVSTTREKKPWSRCACNTHFQLDAVNDFPRPQSMFIQGHSGLSCK